MDVVPTKAPSSCQSLIDCSTNGRIDVPVDSGSIFTEEVGIGVTVKGSEGASIA